MQFTDVATVMYGQGMKMIATIGQQSRPLVHVQIKIRPTANSGFLLAALPVTLVNEMGRAVGDDFVTRRAFTWVHVHHPSSCTVTAQLQLHAFRDFGQVGPESRSAGSSWTPPRPSAIICRKQPRAHHHPIVHVIVTRDFVKTKSLGQPFHSAILFPAPAPVYSCRWKNAYLATPLHANVQH